MAPVTGAFTPNVCMTSEHRMVPEVLTGTSKYPGSRLEGIRPHLPGEKGRSRPIALP